MNRQAAANIISDTFDHPFDEARFQRFVLNLLNDFDSSKTFDYYGAYIPDSFKDHVKRYNLNSRVIVTRREARYPFENTVPPVVW